MFTYFFTNFWKRYSLFILDCCDQKNLNETNIISRQYVSLTVRKSLNNDNVIWWGKNCHRKQK